MRAGGGCLGPRYSLVSDRFEHAGAFPRFNRFVVCSTAPRGHELVSHHFDQKGISSQLHLWADLYFHDERDPYRNASAHVASRKRASIPNRLLDIADSRPTQDDQPSILAQRSNKMHRCPTKMLITSAVLCPRPSSRFSNCDLRAQHSRSLSSLRYLAPHPAV